MTKLTERRMEAGQEREVARRILDLEASVQLALEQIPSCREALAVRTGRVGRTRAAAVDRLEAALAVTASLPAGDVRVVAARKVWAEAQALRWTLAMSASRVCYGEAHKLAANTSVTQQDLVQEGVLGLLDAAKRFEPDRDNRFATYARWWVRAHMTRAIDLARGVHMSAGAAEQLRNLRKQIRIEDLAGRSWTAGDLATKLGLAVDRVRMLMSVGVVRSLDDAAEDGPSLGEQLTDDSRLPPDEACAEAEQVKLLLTTLRTALPERQRRIVMSRYGIGREARSITQIAKGMSLSRERVRQLDRQGIELLRDAYARAVVPGTVTGWRTAARAQAVA